jgi:hypothetical protein
MRQSVRRRRGDLESVSGDRWPRREGSQERTAFVPFRSRPNSALAVRHGRTWKGSDPLSHGNLRRDSNVWLSPGSDTIVSAFGFLPSRFRRLSQNDPAHANRWNGIRPSASPRRFVWGNSSPVTRFLRTGLVESKPNANRPDLQAVAPTSPVPAQRSTAKIPHSQLGEPPC